MNCGRGYSATSWGVAWVTCAASDEGPASMRYWPERRRQTGGDERRVARDDDVVASTVGSWQTGDVEVGETLI